MGCKLLYTGWINKVLLYSTENYIQYPKINHNGKKNVKKCIYIYNWITLLYSRNLHNKVNQLYFKEIHFKKKKLSENKTVPEGRYPTKNNQFWFELSSELSTKPKG